MKPISGKEFCRAVERNGWRLEQIKRLHHACSGEASITTPAHGPKSLDRGLPRNLTKQAGITDEDI